MPIGKGVLWRCAGLLHYRRANDNLHRLDDHHRHLSDTHDMQAAFWLPGFCVASENLHNWDIRILGATECPRGLKANHSIVVMQHPDVSQDFEDLMR